MATRRERVILELEDKFSRETAQAAAATALLNKELSSLSDNAVRSGRSTQNTSRDMDRVAASANRGGRDIDRFSGRLRLLADVAAILGPGLVPIAAVGVPAVAALASQFGAAAVATGTAVLAFQGVGTALEAVNKAAIEPTAENIENARIAMEQIGPAARSFVRELQSMRPAFEALQNAAASGLFPGLERGLADLGTILPNVERVLFRVADAAGDVAAEFAEGIAGPRGQEFLSFMGREVPNVLIDLGHIVGNLAGGMGELMMAFSPVNRDASSWMVDVSRQFDNWAQGLAQTEGFNEFIAYIRENGPRVADAMASIGNAVLQIVEAAAPMGGPVLQGLTAFANVIAAIADSNAGPAIMAMVTALALLNRGMRAIEALKTSALFSALSADADRSVSSMDRLNRAAVAAGLALVGATLVVGELSDAFAEDLPGVQELTGQLMDLGGGDLNALSGDFDSLGDSIGRITDKLPGEAVGDFVFGLFGQQGRNMGEATAEIERLDEALSNLVATQGPAAAESALRNLAEAQGLSGDEFNRLLSILPQYRDALAGAENQSRQTGEAGANAGRRIQQGFTVAQSAAEDFRNELERVNALLSRRASMRDYEQAVDDLAKTLRETDHMARLLNKNGKINIDLPKGREVQEQLDNIANTAIKVTENMRGTQKVQVLNQARRDLIDTARKFGLPRSAIQDLLGMLHTLSGTTARPQVIVDTARVDAQLASVRSSLNAIPDEDVWVTVRRRGTGLGAVGNADGGTIHGQRSPYRDRVLSWLAPGEEVVSNRFGQADRHRELLKAINGNRYADGGTVGGRWHSAPSSTVRVVERVVERMPGQVTLSIPGMGRLVADVADRRISDARTYSDRLDDRD